MLLVLVLRWRTAPPGPFFRRVEILRAVASGYRRISIDTTSTRPAILTDYAKNLIRIKACQLSCRPEFSRSDRDDITQELWLHLLSKARLLEGPSRMR